MSLERGEEANKSKWDMTRVWQFFWGTQRCIILSHACSRDKMIMQFCNSVRSVFVGVLLTLRVGGLEVFLQATATCPDPIVRTWRMLRIPIAVLPLGLVPRRRWWSCLQVSPRLSVEPPTSGRVNGVVEFFVAFKLVPLSLSYLLTVRNVHVFFLDACQVLVMQSFAFFFAWG